MVTIKSCVLASCAIKSTSSGFTKRIFATLASSTSAACRAGANILPNAKIATFLPFLSVEVRLISPLPIASDSNFVSIAAPVPAPRG